MKKILLMCSVLLLTVLSYGQLWAQDRTVTGKVTAADDGTALPGVNVIVKGSNNGTITTADGRYNISVPDNAILVFSFIGLNTQEVPVGTRNVIDVRMQSDVRELGEIIVTGVAEGTSTKKLGFAIGKVNEQTLKEVPGIDAANALRGKVSGVQIIQPSGIPGTAPTIRLRGATSIQGNSDPLIIIDGVITPPGSSLADINMNDVESIEVIKGAAGASLYGSQAGNGVIQIITKRGSDVEGQTRVTVRNEYGLSELQKEVPLTNFHRWQLNDDGSFKLSNPNQPASRIAEADQYVDNPFPDARNQQQELFKRRGFSTNYVSIGSTQKSTNFLASFENLVQNGVVEGVPAFKRRNVRLNVDHKLNDKFKISTSLLYTNSQGPDATERAQGGPFYAVLLAEPSSDLRATNPDGSPFLAFPNPGNNASNPLYSLSTNSFRIDRNRFLGNFVANYQILSWWKVEGQVSYDRANEFFENATQKNTYNQNYLYTGGSMFQFDQNEAAIISTASSYFRKQFGDFNLGLTLRYQFEKYTTGFNSIGGSRFTVDGVPQVQNLDRSTVTTISTVTDIRAENIFANASFDYKDKYIVEGLIRRDGSSLFGADQRYQIFYRTTAAYRVSEDIKIPGIDEFKLRASYGTSGQRPPFIAQYETFNIVNGVAVKNLLGNRDLKPSRVAELELGTNINFLRMFTFEFNYARTVATDQILRVPLTPAAGFAEQYRNAGTLETRTIEFALGADLIRKNDLNWSLNIVANRTRSEITELGVPPYASNGFDGVAGGGGIASAMFRIQAGQPFGVMFGNVLATSLDQLTTNGDGFVNNLVGVTGLRPEDFSINSDGYVVRTTRADGTPNEGSINERALLLLDPSTNQALVTKIGDSNPDLVLGFNNNVSWKNFSLYTLVDVQIGGNVYNATRQLLYFNERHGDLDQSGKAEEQKKALAYYTGSLYNGNNPVNHFVEKGGFLSLREVNLSYNFTRNMFSKFGAVGKVFHDARLSVIGRNLFMITDYSGYNPEVAFGNNSTSFRIDQFTYPVFRTYTAALQLRF
jgi:TonB-linked SusC/RagA family outer membrane protein